MAVANGKNVTKLSMFGDIYVKIPFSEKIKFKTSDDENKYYDVIYDPLTNEDHLDRVDQSTLAYDNKVIGYARFSSWANEPVYLVQFENMDKHGTKVQDVAVVPFSDISNTTTGGYRNTLCYVLPSRKKVA